MKNVVRIIREGTSILFNAAKVIFFPPKDLDPSEVWDATLKLIVTGAFTVGGIAFEDIFEKLLIQSVALAPFANTLSTICIGILIGIATTCTLYLIDKWDPFGVHDRKKRQDIRQKLNEIAQESLQNIDNICQQFGIIPDFSEKERSFLDTVE